MKFGPNIITDGLILSLDAANIKSYPGSGATWKDLSGQGNNGTLTNGPTFNSENNGSIALDGTNDYTNTSFLTQNHFIENQNWTICSWHNVLSNTTQGNSRGGISANQDYKLATDPGGFGLNIIEGKYCVNLTHEIPGGERSGYEGLVRIPIQYDSIEYITATYNNTDKTVKIYRNGVLISSSTNLNYKWSPATGINRRHRIGTSTQGGWTHYFPMRIYSSSMYNIALTPQEVLQNYNSTKNRFI